MTNGPADADRRTGRGRADGRPGRSVLGRIATIIDAFDMGEQVLTLGDLSQRAKLPKSTVHRLVEQLRAIGWLERDHSNGYRVGMRLFELGGLAMQRNQLRDTAFPHLHGLATKTGLAVQLGVLDRGEVVYLERIVRRRVHAPDAPRRADAGVLHRARQGDAGVRRRRRRRGDGVRRCRAAPTTRSPSRPRCAPTSIRSVRRAWRSDVNESYDGLVCVAAPIRNSGRAIAAVSVTGPAEPMDWDGHHRGGQAAPPPASGTPASARRPDRRHRRRARRRPLTHPAADAAVVTPRRSADARSVSLGGTARPSARGSRTWSRPSRQAGHALAADARRRACWCCRNDETTRRPRSSGPATSAPT